MAHSHQTQSFFMVSAEVALREFVVKQKQLLELELRAEQGGNDGNTNTPPKEGGRDGGYLLRNLDTTDTSVGLYGRTVVTFGKSSQESSESDGTTSTNEVIGSALLPAHRLTVGDEVNILPNNGKGHRSGGKSKHVGKHAGGVISAVGEFSVTVALSGGDAGSKKQSLIGKDSIKKEGKKVSKEEIPGDNGEMLGGNPPYALIPKSSVEVHRKIVTSLDQLDVSHPIAGDIIMAAFEPDKSRYNTEISRSSIEALESKMDLASTKLDFSQREAVALALGGGSPIHLIHGKYSQFIFNECLSTFTATQRT